MDEDGNSHSLVIVVNIGSLEYKQRQQGTVVPLTEWNPEPTSWIQTGLVCSSFALSVMYYDAAGRR